MAGFHSTFVTDDAGLLWPEWFRSKYKGVVNFPSGSGRGPISSCRESAVSDRWEELHTDIQTVLTCASNQRHKITFLVYVHECGGITKCSISDNEIKWSEPSAWKRTNGVEHDYCYGCSDIVG